MSANWFSFKRLALSLFMACLMLEAGAQERDTVWVIRTDTVWLEKPSYKLSDIKSQESHNKYDHRVRKYRMGWLKLIPTHTKMQFYGNMGFVSLGFGWDYGRNNQWETDMFVGFLPKKDSKRNKLTFTLKQNYIPWNLQLKNNFSFEPLTTGLYMNTILGDEFWANQPAKYPNGYYGFSTKVRFHIFAGQRLTYDIPNSQQNWAKAITLFYELSSSDLYIVSAFNNRYLKPHDFLALSFGIKLQLL